MTPYGVLKQKMGKTVNIKISGYFTKQILLSSTNRHHSKNQLHWLNSFGKIYRAYLSLTTIENFRYPSPRGCLKLSQLYWRKASIWCLYCSFGYTYRHKNLAQNSEFWRKIVSKSSWLFFCSNANLFRELPSRRKRYTVLWRLMPSS